MSVRSLRSACIRHVWHQVGTKRAWGCLSKPLISRQIAHRNRLQLHHFSGLVPQWCQASAALAATGKGRLEYEDEPEDGGQDAQGIAGAQE